MTEIQINKQFVHASIVAKLKQMHPLTCNCLQVSRRQEYCLMCITLHIVTSTEYVDEIVIYTCFSYLQLLAIIQMNITQLSNHVLLSYKVSHKERGFMFDLVSSEGDEACKV